MKSLTTLLALFALSTLPATAQSKWYGETRFAANDTNWNDTSRFGWIYFPDGEGADPTFAWTYILGWIYTSEEYYPYVYAFEQESWLFFTDFVSPYKNDWRKTLAYNFGSQQWQVNGSFGGFAPAKIHPEEYWSLLGESFLELTPVYYYGPNYPVFTFRTTPVVDGKTMNFRLVLQLRYQREYAGDYRKNRVRIYATPILIYYAKEDYSEGVSHQDNTSSDSRPYGQFSIIIYREYTNYGEYTQQIYLQTSDGTHTPNIYFDKVDAYEYFLDIAKNRLADYHRDPQDFNVPYGYNLYYKKGPLSLANEPWSNDVNSPRSKMVEAMLFALASDRINGTTDASDRVRAKFNLQPDSPVRPDHTLDLIVPDL